MAECASFLSYSLSGPESTAAEEKGYILLHAREPRWFVGNQTTVEIAAYMDAGMHIDDVVLLLAAKYGVDAGMAKEDVRRIGEQLAQHRFLSAEAPSPVRSPSLGSVYLHLTGRCNLACPHCYISSPRRNTDLPTPFVRRLLDELYEAGGESVVFSGGEPLLHPDIRPLLKCAGRNVKVQLLTNGTLIDGDWASFLASEVDTSSVQISIDGSKKEVHDGIRGTGSFDRAVKGMECLQRAGLGERVTIACTIMQQNLEDLMNVIHLAHSLGAAKVRFLPLRRVGRARDQWDAIGANVTLEHYEEFFDQVTTLRDSTGPSINIGRGLSGLVLETPAEGSMDNAWCPVGKMLTVGLNGGVFPCVLMMTDEFRLGNIYDDSLVEMIHSETMLNTCKALAERKTKIEKCAGCLWRNLCQAGCMGQALEESGTIREVDSFCEYRKKGYPAAFDRILRDFVKCRP